MQDNFSSHIAQLKTKHKDTTFTPLFFNGSLSDSGELSLKPIRLFLLMTPTEQFIKALNLNLKNPNIDSITLFSNFNDDEPVSHTKLKYIKTSKYYGLQLSDVTSYFKDDEINIFMYDTLVLDFNSIIYSHYLTKTQFGILSSKHFDGAIPDDSCVLKTVSSYNNVNTDFNGFVILGKIQDYDLFLDMYGSINMLVSYLDNHEVINLSKIIISYLFEKKVHEDTYISDKFPVIYAPFQLYFMEDLNVMLPREDVLELFSREIVECVTLDHEYREDHLPLEDREIITNIKNKILSEMLLNYNIERKKQIEDTKRQCKELYDISNEQNVKELDEKKQKKCEELDVFFEQEKKHRREILDVQHEKEKVEIARKIKEIEDLAQTKAEEKKITEFKKIDIEIQKKLDNETTKLSENIKDIKIRAHLTLKQEIEAFTKTAYANLDEEIKQTREQKIQEINLEISLIGKSQLERIKEDHQAEKRRLDVLLKEYDISKRQEFESLQRTEYFKKLSSSLIELETYVESVKKEKLDQLQLEVNKATEMIYEKLRASESCKSKEIDEKLKLHEEESTEKVDSYIKELTVQRMKTEETRVDNELRLLRESKRKEMEEEEMSKIKRECAAVKEEFIKQIHLEIETFKRNEYDRCKLDVEEKVRTVHSERIQELDALLNKQGAERKQAQDTLLDEEKQIKLRELDELIRVKLSDVDELISVKLSERTAELHSYKTEKLKEINIFLQQFKENELSKFELTNQVRDNKMKEKRTEQEKEIELEMIARRQEKLKEITAELTKERKKISAELEKQSQEILEARTIEQERVYTAKLQDRFRNLEEENEALVAKLLASSKRDYDDYLEENRKEKLELEKLVIEEHNKQLRELEEEHNKQLRDLEEDYQEKNNFHKSLLKDSIKEERQKLLASEKDGIAKEVSEYKQARISELEEKLTVDLARIKEERLLSINKEITAYREKQMEQLKIEFLEWKRSQEEGLKRKFKSLYSDL